jgi:ornithine carbamoyltransferase
MGRPRHLLSIGDLSDSELVDLVRRGCRYATATGPPGAPLADRIVGLYFRKTSTRTRTAFASGALRLGAQIVMFGPHDLQENTGESAQDTGRVLSRMLDALVARTTAAPAEMRTYACQPRMAVINAMSADEHPTQALADLTAMLRRFGSIEGLQVLYVGEGNNTAAALTLALSRFHGVALHLRTPAGYGLAEDKLEAACLHARRSGARIDERHDLDRLPRELDVVYTTRWETTGTTKPDEHWHELFRPFRVDASLMGRYPAAVFMHDLPAHRGQEVEAAVLDGPASIAFEQAESKLYSAMSVLEWCVSGT